MTIRNKKSMIILSNCREEDKNMDGKQEKEVKTIQSVNRALDLLEAVIEYTGGYRLGELAQKCGLNKTTAFHLLKTLEARGYVEQSYDTQLYKAGWKSLDLFSSFYQNLDIRPIALPYMEQIQDRTDETVTLYFYSRIDNYYMAVANIQLESSQELKFSSRLGSRIPLHCTAAGKVRLLGYSDEMLDEQLRHMPLNRYTTRTITNVTVLRREVEQIRQNGFCIEQGEYDESLCSVAVPLFKYTGRVMWGMTVTLPTVRATDKKLNEIAAVLMDVLRYATNHPDFTFKGAPIPQSKS